MTSSSGSASNCKPKYFDLITTGYARLKRVRNVPVPRGAAKLSCDLKAFHGERGAASITPFDVRVVGEDAKLCVDRNRPEANDGRQDVYVKFDVGDASIHTFAVDEGEGAVLKARLLKCERVNPAVLPDTYQLLTRGLGYLNFAREVETDSGVVLTCNLNALVGPEPTSPEEKVARVPFDVTVTGEEAAALIRQYKEAINGRKSVFVGFSLSGARIHSYLRKGEHEGELGYAIQSDLIKFSFVTVDGQRVFTAASTSKPSDDVPAESGNRRADDPNEGSQASAA